MKKSVFAISIIMTVLAIVVPTVLMIAFVSKKRMGRGKISSL
jgi:hypothetical protein